VTDIRDQFLEHKRQELRGSLFKLCHFLGFKDVNQRTHDDIIYTLENGLNRKLICVPRGSLKSSIACVAYVIWLLIINPNIRILIDSEVYTNSKNFLREIKSHLEGSRLTALFGQFRTRDSVWNEGEIIIAQRTVVKKEASITVGGIGTTKVGQHFDVIIGDDYNSPNNTNTPENAQKVIDHYRYNISILEPGGIYVVIGTRYGENDLIGYILNNEETVKVDDYKKGA
jgi:hypothetical protein